jgi:hypothetical protein
LRKKKIYIVQSNDCSDEDFDIFASDALKINASKSTASKKNLKRMVTRSQKKICFITIFYVELYFFVVLFILNLIITIKNLLSLNSAFILYMNTFFSKRDPFSQ